jgi:hypothetical protein
MRAFALVAKMTVAVLLSLACSGCLQETSQGPVVYVIYDSWLSDTVDRDNDGCYEGYTLNWDANVSSGTHSVKARVYYRVGDSGSWTLFTTTSCYSITGTSSSDASSISIDAPHGASCEYRDWRIDLYECSGGSAVATREPSDDNSLSQVGLEDEGAFSICCAYFENQVDTDQDGYYCQFDLRFDPDVSTGSALVYAEVYYKPHTSSIWTLFYTTSAWTITGSDTDDARVLTGIAGSSQGYYDYKIKLYRDSDDVLVATLDPSGDADLGNHPEDTDCPASQTFSICCTYFENQVDTDQDGYYCQFDLRFDPDVSTGSALVYAEAYYKPHTSGIWTLFYTTSAWTITGDDTDDARVLTGIAGSSQGHYDYKIELYRDSDDVLVATLDPSGDADLGNHPEDTDCLNATLTGKSTLGAVPAPGVSKEAKTTSNQDTAPTEKSTLGIVPAQGTSKEAK